MVNIEECISRLEKRELLGSEVIRWMCVQVKEVLVNEPNILSLSAPVTVVGDVHGQFMDLLEIFKVGGPCPSTNYLFLGDYVDRGHHSVETISLLCCLKLRYPSRINLIRGNHESRAVTQVYGFYLECIRKYGSPEVWGYFTDLFDYMAIAAVIDDSIFCVHGGLSPSLQTLDQIRVLNRFQEIPHEGPLSDLMWSDPDPDKEDFSTSPRGTGYIFGKHVVSKFLDINGVNHILRAHQLCMEGFQVLFDGKLSTVWSAPNYSYRCGNKASILEVSEKLERRFNLFDAAPESRLNDDTVPNIAKAIPDYFL